MDTIESQKASTLIPIQLEKSEANQCPYIGWYLFKQCTIKTCKNFSIKTSTRCLGLDRVAPIGNKIISDAELHLFKFSTEGVSTRLVSMRRKKAVFNVKSILALFNYINWLDDRYGQGPEASKEYLARELGLVESSYPLKIRRLQFKNWMWDLLLSDKEFERFVASKKGDPNEFEFELKDLLGLNDTEISGLRKIVKDVGRKSTKVIDPSM